MNEIKQGEIYSVNFDPSVGHEYLGRRPAIVIQSDSASKTSKLITIMAITSSLNNKLNDDIFIKANKTNFLYKDSIIKVFDICSFDCSRFIKKIGKADAQTIAQIKKYLVKHFGL